MRGFLQVFIVVGLVMLGGVAPAWAGDNAFFGTGVGAALGGLLGSQFGHGDGRLAATGMGVFFGGLAGNEIGHSMDRAVTPSYGYAYSAAPTYYYASPVYQPNYVAPPDPPPTYIYQDSENYCREYSQQIRIGNRIQESYGTACLQPDGTWRIVP